ncbi:MAG: hypothetical protein ACOYJC_05860 [Christensenellales bacterium]
MLEQQRIIEEETMCTLAQAIEKTAGAEDVGALEGRLAKLNLEFEKTLQTIPRNAEDSQKRDQEFLRIASEKESLNQQLSSLRQEQEIMAYTSGRVKALFDPIRKKGGALSEYDDRLAAQIIQQVTVLSKDWI